MADSVNGFYYELATTRGGWTPRWSASAPRVKNGRVHTYGGGPGARIRCLQPIGRHGLKPTLEQLQAKYGPDGHLRAHGYLPNRAAGRVQHDVGKTA